MDPEHKRYILENAGTKSVREIAGFLGLKEKAVKRIIDEAGTLRSRAPAPQETRSEPEAPAKPARRTTLAAIAAIALLGTIVYANSLRGQFLYDDLKLVSENAYIKTWADLPRILTSDIGAGSGAHFNFYRPVQMLTYMVDYAVWGMRPFGFHLTSVVLHIAVSVLVFLLLATLFGDAVLAAMAAALFVVHPIHTEAVAYISSRADLCMAFFMLLTYLIYVRQPRGAIFWSALFTACACLSKEYGMMIPALALVYHYAFRKRIDPKRFSALVLVPVLFLAAKATVLSGAAPLHAPQFPFTDRVVALFVAVAKYTAIMLFPVGLHMEYGFTVFRMTDPRALAGLVMALLWCAAPFVFRRDVRVRFALPWVLVSFLPVSGLFPLNAYMAEHWLYIPSIGIFLILAGAIRDRYVRAETRLPAKVAFGALIVYFGVLTVVQNGYWRDATTFYRKTLETSHNTRVYNNLAREYILKGMFVEALDACTKAIELDGTNHLAYINLAHVYANTGRREKAIEALRKAIELKPDDAEAYNNLAVIYGAAGKKKDAMELLETAIRLDPQFSEAYNNLAIEYFSSTPPDKERAVALFRKAIEANPSYTEAYENLARAYRSLGRDAEALEASSRAREIKARAGAG